MVRQLMHTSKKLITAALHLNNCPHRSIHGSTLNYNFNSINETIEPAVLVEKDDHITLIGLNCTEKRNAINRTTAKELCEALNAFENDETSPVAVLYGLGGSLSAGSDLMDLNEQLSNNTFESTMKTTSAMGPTRRHIRKPVVCAINGYCVAGGLELALLCDLRVMEDTATIGFYGRNSGIFLSDGGTARLPAMIGYSRALDLLLTGRRVSAQEALQIGLVNRIVATGTSLGQAVNLAFSIAKFPLAALQRDRSVLYDNWYERRKGFHFAVKRETQPMSTNVLDGIQEGVNKFKNSKVKGAKTNSWNIKPKLLQDWELEEIEFEQRAKCSK